VMCASLCPRGALAATPTLALHDALPILAQAKFVHTVAAGYVSAAMFVAAISAWYLLRGRHLDIAKRSMAVAASFGLAASLSVVVLGDESGYLSTEHQKMKLAAMESMWETEAAPASFNIVAWPNQAERRNEFAVHVAWAMGLIGTRSISKQMPGINGLVDSAERRIANGMRAYAALERVRADADDRQARELFAETWPDLGYGLLLKRYRDDVQNATPDEIEAAAFDTVPQVMPLFWTFRVMVALGFYFIGFFAFAFWLVSTG